jgi:hypothetical protein
LGNELLPEEFFYLLLFLPRSTVSYHAYVDLEQKFGNGSQHSTDDSWRWVLAFFVKYFLKRKEAMLFSGLVFNSLNMMKEEA